MPESGSESQWEPEWESQRAIESQRETGRDPVKARKSQWKPDFSPKWIYIFIYRSCSYPFGRLVTIFFSIPKHCFVAKQLNKTLFCRDASKYGIFCRKLLKYALWAKKNGWKCDESRLHTLSHSDGYTILYSILLYSWQPTNCPLLPIEW